jgi:hypothetical protein
LEHRITVETVAWALKDNCRQAARCPSSSTGFDAFRNPQDLAGHSDDIRPQRPGWVLPPPTLGSHYIANKVRTRKLFIFASIRVTEDREWTEIRA